MGSGDQVTSSCRQIFFYPINQLSNNTWRLINYLILTNSFGLFLTRLHNLNQPTYFNLHSFMWFSYFYFVIPIFLPLLLTGYFPHLCLSSSHHSVCLKNPVQLLTIQFFFIKPIWMTNIHSLQKDYYRTLFPFV